MSELEDINGVGPSRAESLREAGFENVEDVATASLDDLIAVFDRDNVAEDIRGKAREMVFTPLDEDEGAEEAPESDEEDADEDEEEDADEDEEEDADEDEEEDADEDEEEDEEESVHHINVDIEDHLRNHVIAGLVMVEKRETKRKYMDRVEATRDLMEQVREGENEFVVTDDQLHIFFMSLNQLFDSYRGEAGLDVLTGEVNKVRDEVREHRRRLLF